VVWKGLARLREQQSVRVGDRVVAILSAHGLKATAAIERLLEPP
jgi:threonine synthase